MNFITYCLVRDVHPPHYSTKDSAGIDFYIPLDVGDANENWRHEIWVEAHSSVLIPSGVKMGLPAGTFLLGSNRSSVAKKGLVVGAGVIDSDYTGEIHLHLINTTDKGISLKPGQKIMQYILLQSAHVLIVEAQMLEGRGTKGFGSTG